MSISQPLKWERKYLLEKINPVQFIEGFNEDFPFRKGGSRLNIRDYPWIAIQHISQNTYLLNLTQHLVVLWRCLSQQWN